MTETERNKLFDENCPEYIGIGITFDGGRVGSIGVPWEHTTTAFNMKTPDVYLCPSDVFDEDIMAELKKHKVVGCYIFTSLEDYGFLSQLKDLRDVFICYGENLRDLSFLSELNDCFMIYIEDAHLKNLDFILEQKKYKFIRMRWCIALYNCIVEDNSAVKDDNAFISELLVWNKKKDVDFDTWKGSRANTTRVRLIKEE